VSTAQTKQDKKALACNYAVATKVCPQNALCYIIDRNPGSGGERVKLLARSRGGRWVEKWEVRWRLHNFRVKTVPSSNPIHGRVPDYPEWTKFDAVSWDKIASEERGARLEKFGPSGYGKAHVNA
jgi:hypothetical protein